MLGRTYWLIALVAFLAGNLSQASVTPHAQAGNSADVRRIDQRAPAVVSHLKISGARRAGRLSPDLSRKLDGHLAEIAQNRLPVSASLRQWQAINPATRFRLSVPLVRPEVLIDAVAEGDVATLLADLRSLGLESGSSFSNDVGGWLPVDAIPNAMALASLRFARASMPRTRAIVAVQGDFAQGSSRVRNTYSTLTGKGVTVGVLSDSFNCYQTYADNGVPASGFNGYASNGFVVPYAADQAGGALPAGVNVLKEASCMDYGAPLYLPETDEGRAMLQIVHAVAPDASLAFHTAVESEADFANGIIALANAGAKVIVDDVGYEDEPFYQDGLIAQAIDQVAARGVTYFSAAGNAGPIAYENRQPTFPVANSDGTEQLLNFDATGFSVATSLDLSIPELLPGEYVPLILAWDQPFVTGAPGSPGASSSLDLCIVSSSGTDPVATLNGEAVSCTGPNAVGADPIQVLVIGNPANAPGNSAPETVSISVGLRNGTPPPGRIKFVLNGNGALTAINRFDGPAATIHGHPSAAGAAAVGAIFWAQTSTCGERFPVVELYTSSGGDPIMFDTSGARLSPFELRHKPDFVAPDGANDTFLGFTLASADVTVSSTVLGCQNHAEVPNFFGTSAAAPHAAGAAALLWQANPTISPAQLIGALQNTAESLGIPGYPDNISGYGFIHVDAALASLPPPPPTLSIAPTAVTAGDKVILSWASLGTGCFASGSWNGAKAASGSETVTAGSAGTNTYTLRCSSPGGAASSSVSLTVNGKSGGGGSLDFLTLLVILGSFGLARASRPFSPWRSRESNGEAAGAVGGGSGAGPPA